MRFLVPRNDNILNKYSSIFKAKLVLEYRKIQLKKLQKEVVDLGLNDFRVDLSNFLKKYGKIKNISEGIYTVAEAKNDESKRVIFVLRNINNKA